MPLPKLNPEQVVEQESVPKSDRTEASRARTGGHEVIDAALAADAIAGLREQLNATKRYWVAESSSWETAPDYATRQKAIDTILAYHFGKPVERQVKLTGSFESYSDKLEKLLASPEGISNAIALGLITNEQATTRKQKLKKRAEVAD